jgi:hypothetical protein
MKKFKGKFVPAQNKNKGDSLCYETEQCLDCNKVELKDCPEKAKGVQDCSVCLFDEKNIEQYVPWFDARAAKVSRDKASGRSVESDQTSGD